MTKMFPFIPRLQQHRLKWKMHVHWSGCGRILQNEMCPPWMWLSVSASVQPDWVTKAKEVSTMRDESTWYLGLSLNDKQLLLHSSSQVWASHLIRHHQQTALGKKIHCSNDVLKTRERLSKKKLTKQMKWDELAGTISASFSATVCMTLKWNKTDKHRKWMMSEWKYHLRPLAFSNFMVFKSYRTTYRVCPPIVSSFNHPSVSLRCTDKHDGLTGAAVGSRILQVNSMIGRVSLNSVFCKMTASKMTKLIYNWTSKNKH